MSKGKHSQRERTAIVGGGGGGGGEKKSFTNNYTGSLMYSLVFLYVNVIRIIIIIVVILIFTSCRTQAYPSSRQTSRGF